MYSPEDKLLCSGGFRSTVERKRNCMATVRRFYVDKIERETLLTGDEFSHAKNVLRLREGDEIVLLDGSGSEYDAVVNRIEKGAMLCGVVGSRPSDKEAKVRVKLLIGALKGDKTELVVQKATELGAHEIAVFSSRYCAAYMNENKLERLQKVAREAAKQCLRATVPNVEYCDSLAAALGSCSEYEHKLFACEFAHRSDFDLHALTGSAALVVGSEGGFSEEEFAAAQAAGFAGITLGRRILRAETAAIAFLSAVMFELGEWA